MISRLKIITLAAFITSASAGGHPSTPLFNGQNFEGWIVPANNIWWTAEEGVMKVQSGPEQKGSILWTEAHFEDFALNLEFRMGEGNIDSGVFLRTEKQQIQIGISGSLQRDMTGSLYVPDHGYPGQATGVDALLRPSDWNTLRIKAIGNRYQVALNEEPVMDYTSEFGITEGPIGLQLHGNREMAIEFRRIEIRELK